MSFDRPKMLMRWVALKRAAVDPNLRPIARATAKRARDLAFVALGLDAAAKRKAQADRRHLQ
jgi:hypothetical protein